MSELDKVNNQLIDALTEQLEAVKALLAKAEGENEMLENNLEAAVRDKLSLIDHIELLEGDLERAHMAGQIDAGVDPSFSNAQVWVKALTGKEEEL